MWNRDKGNRNLKIKYKKQSIPEVVFPIFRLMPTINFLHKKIDEYGLNETIIDKNEFGRRKKC
jgi:hypothetical protein